MIAGININNTNPNATSFKGGAPKLFTIKNEKVLKNIESIGKYSSPQSRFILGLTALFTQPFIDLNNKRVDEETRRVSTARTIAKIIAGTVTGVIIRAGCIRGVEELTKENSTTKWGKALIPDNVSFKNLETELSKHRKALGTCVALIVMLFTNFAIDVPLTKYLTNYFNKKLQKQNQKGGN